MLSYLKIQKEKKVSRLLTAYGFVEPLCLPNKCIRQKVKNMDKEFMKVENRVFKFEKVGDSITGFLLNKEKSAVYDNMTYQLKTDTETIIFFGSSVLNDLMTSVNIGDEICIEFKDLKASKTKGHQPIKIFEVGIKPR